MHPFSGPGDLLFDRTLTARTSMIPDPRVGRETSRDPEPGPGTTNEGPGPGTRDGPGPGQGPGIAQAFRNELIQP